MPLLKEIPFSLQNCPIMEDIHKILSAAIQAVDPEQAVHRVMKQEGDRLIIDRKRYDLARFENIYIVGAGKAGAPMAKAVAQILGDKLTGGVILIKEGYQDRSLRTTCPSIEFIEAGHPIPDQPGILGAEKIIRLLNQTSENDLVLCLISGGGSALLTAPADGITLPDLQALTKRLLHCGATINEINSLRKHLERLKGGQLARQASQAKIASLILSDVIGDPLDVIASGPTVPDPTTFQDGYQILLRYHLLERIPPAILERLSRGITGEVPETPKASEPYFENVQNVIISSNMTACQAGWAEAQSRGYNSMLITTCLQGEARQAGRYLASILGNIAANRQPVPRPACLIAGGETTVNVLGDGIGGRNLEVALGAVNDLAGLDNVALITLATDGEDGTTSAAGAVVTGKTLERAKQMGMNPLDFLNRNDAYHFFEKIDDLVITGPTQTNVNDLNFLFA